MEEKACPIDCPNRSKKMGKGYSYFLALVLTMFLGSQSLRLKVDGNGWEIGVEPVPMHVFIPGIAVIASVLGFETDRLMSGFGGLLTKGEKD